MITVCAQYASGTLPGSGSATEFDDCVENVVVEFELGTNEAELGG
jgi:hypothetical protein